MSIRIRVDDVVQVMAGRRNRNPDKPPTRGRVLRVDRESGLVWIEGINRRTRHLKKSQKNPQGGRVERESPVAVSNIMLVTDAGIPVRLSKAVRGKDGKVTAKAGAEKNAAK